MILSQQISLLYLFFLCYLEKIDAVIQSGSGSLKNYNHLDPKFMIHKVSLTQKGYIQFLKYTSEVPTLTEYTFCLWVRSNNLTHNQPLLSYSKHEEERLIRVWISPRGKTLNLEILRHTITKVPVNILENRWYHICQSWSSSQAAWEVYIDGLLESSGFVPKLKGVPIKGGGDIVVGQEYTDFDKGLDDGIEGDVFGFNFVLASTSWASKHPIKLENYPLRRYSGEGKRRKPQLHPYKTYLAPQLQFNLPPQSANRLIVANNNRDFGGGYFHVLPNRQAYSEPRGYGFDKFKVVDVPVYSRRRIMNDIGGYHKPLGLLLVELSFDCAFRKGAPLSGKGVLVNWAKSPVRVYGGAILKDVPPFCRG